MCRIVVPDASCLIALNDLGELDLLRKLYDRVLITSVVKTEFHGDLPDWIEITDDYDDNLENRLKETLDAGESSAISLADRLYREGKDCRIVLDDRRGRNRAKLLGVKLTGTIALLETGFARKLIEEGKPIKKHLLQRGFYANRELLDRLPD